MPYNGSGLFLLAQAAFVPGTPISSSAVNSDLSDIATNGLTKAVTRDGQGAMDGNPTLPLQVATKQYVDSAVSGSLTGAQGRLTLATGVPVMATTQAAKTTIFYTPYLGDKVPIYDGSLMTMTDFAELSVATTDTTKSPAAIGASKVNDWFVWNDAGTLRVGHGPDWTDDVTRSAGTALVRVSGILLNNASITNGPAASRGTYVGTTRSNASSQLDWIIGGSGSGGVAGFLNVWNAYNRVISGADVNDTTSTWTYSSVTPRAANGSNSNRVSFMCGLQEDSIDVSYTDGYGSTSPAGFAVIGFALDATNALDRDAYVVNPAGATIQAASAPRKIYSPKLGFHFIQATEATDGNVAAYSGGLPQGLMVTLRM